MKRLSLLILLFIVLLSACGTKQDKPSTLSGNEKDSDASHTGEVMFTESNHSAYDSDSEDTLTYKGETSKGTPIVDSEKSKFDVDTVKMIKTPDSSCFSEIGYDSDYEILVLTFKTSGTYLYLDFSESDWEEFRKADSLGTYYNRNIKGQYECNKWD